VGYLGFSNDELRDAISEWGRDAPHPGSPEAHARCDAQAEVERRRAARLLPSLPMVPATPTRHNSRHEVGDRIELHTQFDDSWSPGFEVAEVLQGGYRVRRSHDSALLPDPTGEDDARAAR